MLINFNKCPLPKLWENMRNLLTVKSCTGLMLELKVHAMWIKPDFKEVLQV